MVHHTILYNLIPPLLLSQNHSVELIGWVIPRSCLILSKISTKDLPPVPHQTHDDMADRFNHISNLMEKKLTGIFVNRMQGQEETWFWKVSS